MQENKSHYKVEYSEIYNYIHKRQASAKKIIENINNKEMQEHFKKELAVLEMLEKYTDNAYNNMVKARIRKQNKKEGK